MEFQGLKPTFFDALYVAAEAATHKDLRDIDSADRRFEHKCKS
jgi:hypothetical protein